MESKKQARDFGLPGFKSNQGNADRRAILMSNQRIRDGLEDKPRDFGEAGGFGRVALRIPEFDYPFIRAMFPDTTSPDAETRTKGWQKFARSPLSEPYRTDRKVRKGGI